MPEIRKPRDWKQQFFEVKKIGPEPALNREGFWKKPDPPKIRVQEERINDQPDNK